MTTLLRPAASLLLFFTLLTGLAYPALVTELAQAAFPDQANGSLLRDKDAAVVGSKLIGQGFADGRYFWSRPSAVAYNAGTSCGSNLGPSNPALHDAVKGRVEALRAAEPANQAKVPVDLVTASGSGLDPEISPAAAYYQVSRVARLRNLPEAQLKALVATHVQGRTLGILGEARVNVLQLNLGLDQLASNP